MRKLANACAQALVAWIITWIIVGFLMLYYKGSNESGAVLIDILSEFPLFSVWFKILGAYTIGQSNPELVVTLTALAYVSVFFDSLFVGFTVHIVKSLKKGNTVNILSTYLGVVISFLLMFYIKKSNEFTAIIIEIIVIVIMFYGVKMMVTGKVWGKVFDIVELWTIFVDSVYGVLVCGYISKIVMITSGCYASFIVAVWEIIIFSIALLIGGYAAYILTGEKLF